MRSYRDDGELYAGQIGSEDTPDLFLDALDECMVEWGRVLKPSGSVWVNLGDKYSQRTQTRRSSHQPGIFPDKFPEFAETWKERREAGAVRMPKDNIIGDGYIPEKSLMGLPWRFAIRQIDNGWILRAEVIWDKPNGLPESVTDRVRRSHETWFHFTLEPRYFSGVDEIREPYQSTGLHAFTGHTKEYGDQRNDDGRNMVGERDPLGRLPGSVWSIPSEPLLIHDDTRKLLDLPDHFAAFPQEWPRRIILGWSPTGICVKCGEGRRPVVSKSLEHVNDSSMRAATERDGQARRMTNVRNVARESATIDRYECDCAEPNAPTQSAVVVDPFGGTGTVSGVARMLGRYGISNDLSASYNRLAIWRITQSGHFTKTEQRSWADRQGQLL